MIYALVKLIVLFKSALSLQGVWEYTNCAMWKQGWCEEQAGEGQASYLPQEEEFAVLWDISKEQLQFWEAFPLLGSEACWVIVVLQYIVSYVYVYVHFVLVCEIWPFYCSDPNLHFVESPALRPPEVQIDLAEQQR